VTGPSDPLLDNPRAFARRIADALDGTPISLPGLDGFRSSDSEPFFNQLFARGRVGRRAATEFLQGKPGFVWLDELPTDDEHTGDLLVLEGMLAHLERSVAASPAHDNVAVVESRAELKMWHDVYSEVSGVGPDSHTDWRRVHDALGPRGDDSLVLFAASVDGVPAATASVFFDRNFAGLYFFCTRGVMRRRGLATALVEASHAAARARGVDRAILHASHLGRPVYARASYRTARQIPALRFRSPRRSDPANT
jgi:GNAT superfamily N-acetyltransferase